MKVRVTLARPSGPHVDLVVTADASAPIGHVAQAIVEADPYRIAAGGPPAGDVTLGVHGADGASAVLAPEVELGQSSLASGSLVEIVPPGAQATRRTQAQALVNVVVTDAAGGRHAVALAAGTHYLGREAGNAIYVPDALVSKVHARIDVSEAGVRVVDLNSANGILLDGKLVSRAEVTDGLELVFGDTAVAFGLAPREAARRRAGPIEFMRSPRVEVRYAGREHEAPELPSSAESEPFPWIAMIAPLAMGVVMYLVTQSMLSIMFVALSPILMLGNYVSGKLTRKRRFEAETAKFDEHLATLDVTLAQEIERERQVRLAEHPATIDVYGAAVHLDPLLWTRRPEHWSFLAVRLGTGTLPSRNSVAVEGAGSSLPAFLSRLLEVVDRHAVVADVPVAENLHHAGALGVAGDRGEGADGARAILAQLAGLHSPAELAIAAVIGLEWTPEFEWLTWIPHTASPLSPLAGEHLANSATSATALVASLEELVQERLAAATGEREGRGPTTVDAAPVTAGAVAGRDPESALPPPAPTPAVVVLVTHDAPVDKARLVQLAETSADAGVYLVWVAPSVAELPGAARSYLSFEADGAGLSGFVRQGSSIAGLVPERLSRVDAMAFAKALAPVNDAGAHVVDASDVPRSVSLVTLLGPATATDPGAVTERWLQNGSIHDRSGGPVVRAKRPGRLRALVGRAALDAIHLDLREQGPHALVGGTTGSGKSEFLQAWVLGMAAEYSPDRVTFLFVDYKGGAAFADCINLPHAVGIVTDLNQHLVRRALTSLRAELHHRERLFARKKVKDLLELERSGDPECPPALVIVIDEFAALVGEVPEFVDGVVDVAQRGRSLGIHLIMATQRPAGVIKDNLRANTNMRVALRMADESDSTDVVGEPLAGTFSPDLPGRGVAKTGPGRLTVFQSAYAGGWTSDTPPPPAVEIAELRFGSEITWERPESDEPRTDNEGPTDQQRLVRTFTRAAQRAGVPAPRRPWLDMLPEVFDLTKLRQRTDTELLLGVRDVPAHQLQEEVYFNPDQDGNIAIYGTGGSGKTVTLRTLAVSAGITPRGGPVDVYGIDYAGGGLSMLEAMPHVGSVVTGADPERIIRLLRMLRAELESRAPRYAAANAGSITDYRQLVHAPHEQRILLLIDGFPAFREEFESTSARAAWYAVVQQIISEGRQLGIHVAFTADRSGAVPNSIMSGVQRRVVLRLADEGQYGMLDVASDILAPSSPPGRCVLDGLEAQIAIPGASASVADQARTIASVGESLRKTGRSEAEKVGILLEEYPLSLLPATIDDLPVLGVAEDTLKPFGFEPTGSFILAGGPGSGRTTALESILTSLRRAEPGVQLCYIAPGPTDLGAALPWDRVAVGASEAKSLAETIEGDVASGAMPRTVVAIEAIGEFLMSSADDALAAMIKALRMSGKHLVIGDAETSSWTSSWPLIAELKAGRTGILLQPDHLDGDTLFKVSFPRTARSEFSPGRGYYVTKGRFTRVQIPVVLTQGLGG